MRLTTWPNSSRLCADVMRLAATMSDDVSGGIGRTGRQINQAGREARTTATTSILNHPLMAFSMATGLGLVLGLLAMSR